MLFRLFIALFIFAAIPAPLPGHRVHDLANILDADVESRIEAKLFAVERETTAEVGLLTVSSLDGMTVDEYANEVFNHWGIGKRDMNNGILMLVAPKERRVRFEIGYGLEPLISDSRSGLILDDFVVPRFKSGDYPGGIEAGLDEVVRMLRENPQLARGVAGSAPPSKRDQRMFAFTASVGTAAFAVLFLLFGWLRARRENYSTIALVSGSIILLLLLLATGLYAAKLKDSGAQTAMLLGGGVPTLWALISNLRKYFRYGPHACKKCGSKLILLSEQADDAKLTEVQQLEEKIGSVDYDVWYCPACLVHDTVTYVSGFSGFQKCPQCGARTYKEVEKTINYPTTFSTGLARIDGNCVSCKHSTTRTRILPRRTQSSSSSGGSFGGGSSGGGSFGGGSSGGGGSSRGW